MDTDKLLIKIGELLDDKLKPVKNQLATVETRVSELIDDKLKPIKDQLNTVEMKIEVVNQRVERVEQNVDNLEQRLEKKIDQVEKQLEKKIIDSQQDTIEVLSDLIHTGYDLHEKRIKKLEDQASLS